MEAAHVELRLLEIHDQHPAVRPLYERLHLVPHKHVEQVRPVEVLVHQQVLQYASTEALHPLVAMETEDLVVSLVLELVATKVAHEPVATVVVVVKEDSKVHVSMFPNLSAKQLLLK